jgi:hypothetical protein
MKEEAVPYGLVLRIRWTENLAPMGKPEINITNWVGI